jgi:NTE family protein
VPTLERVVDFDYLNDGGPPLIVTCVDVTDGSLVQFDSRIHRIEPRHILASTAFVPAFPPVEINGRMLIDPGVVVNLPVEPILDEDDGDITCFAVDLFDTRGEVPTSLDSGLERAQDIAFAAQSQRAIDAFRARHRLKPGRDIELVLVAYRAPPGMKLAPKR